MARDWVGWEAEPYGTISGTTKYNLLIFKTALESIRGVFRQYRHLFEREFEQEHEHQRSRGCGNPAASRLTSAKVTWLTGLWIL